MIPTGGLSVLGRVVSYTYMPAKTPQKLCWFQVREDTEKGFVWVYRYKSLEMKSSIRFHMFAVFDKSFKTNFNPFRCNLKAISILWFVVQFASIATVIYYDNHIVRLFHQQRCCSW